VGARFVVGCCLPGAILAIFLKPAVSRPHHCGQPLRAVVLLSVVYCCCLLRVCLLRLMEHQLPLPVSQPQSRSLRCILVGSGCFFLVLVIGYFISGTGILAILIFCKFWRLASRS
jgi:hypothetical protein